MAVAIDSITQLGIGWEVTFRPAEEGETLSRFFSDHGFRMVALRAESRPEGELGCLEIEQPGGESLKQQVIDLLRGNPAIDMTAFQEAEKTSEFGNEG